MATRRSCAWCHLWWCGRETERSCAWCRPTYWQTHSLSTGKLAVNGRDKLWTPRWNQRDCKIIDLYH
jgi:hypothetical protein